jgi:hypothetical protein
VTDGQESEKVKWRDRQEKMIDGQKMRGREEESCIAYRLS